MRLYGLEGNTQKLDGGAMFGNAPKAMWEKWIQPDNHNRIDLACRSLLVVTEDGKKILFEAGIGAFFDPKMKERFGVQEDEHVLLSSLEKVGFSDADITHVVLSHLHFDHAGGVLSAFSESASPSLLFPNARFFVGQEHWKRACNPHPRDRASFIPELNTLLNESGRLVLLTEQTQTDLAHLVRFRFSHGHTPGLMLSEIKTENGLLVFSSDLIPGQAWVHVPLTMGYDRFPEMVVDEKRKLLEDLVGNNGMLFFTHDSHVMCGRIVVDAKGKFSSVAVDVSQIH
jgi:glyoxylase-like metal-dependent hydrolase (beta-lactamase superfamily II)